MKIRITTVRALPGWDLKAYASNMAKNGVPIHKVEEFLKSGSCSIVAGSPGSICYQTTKYEVLDETSPVTEIPRRMRKKKDE